MRLTVGPLPPAVYWRRRAIVLGAVLFIVIVLYSSCGGSDGSGAGRLNTGATSSPTGGTGGQPVDSATPTATAGLSGVLPTSEPSETAEPDSSLPAPDPEPVPPAAPDSPCTNDEMTLTPTPAKTSAQRGSPVDLRLKITNSSSRTCERDVGADLQELRLVQGAQTIWSSDHCGAARGSDLRTFSPGAARDYMVTWNGKSSSKCTSGVPAGPVPAAGEYQLVARLGNKLSTPVKLTLR